MNLPERFILAFPHGGNKYIYYNAYWVDMVAKTITHTSDDYNGCTLSCRTVFYNHFENAINLTKNRIKGKPSIYEREFINNGIYIGPSWFHHYLNEKNVNAKHRDQSWPIRFEPYAANFVDGDFVTWIHNKELDDIHDKLYKPFFGRGVTYDAPFSAWSDCESILLRAFEIMDHSQVRFRIDGRKTSSVKIKKLKDMYKPLLDVLLRSPWAENNKHSKLIDAIFPPKSPNSVKKIQEVIKSSIQRFIRRHPTQATSNLLKMLASGFKIEKSPLPIQP
jgi:hypothetical protein